MCGNKVNLGAPHSTVFVAKLLRIPELVGVQAASALPGLYTSMRIRCFERVAARVCDLLKQHDEDEYVAWTIS